MGFDVSACIKDNYINREYSWLQFNKRVLDQAMDLTNPLLERCKFLSIFTSNLDEFIQVRLGHLFNLNQTDSSKVDELTGLTSKEQICAIEQILPSLYNDSSETFHFLKDELYQRGVNIIKADDLSDKQKSTAYEIFSSSILPRVNPIVLDSKHPMFKFENLETYLILSLERKGKFYFAVAKTNSSTPRLFNIRGGKKTHLITRESLLYAFCDKVFPGFIIKEKALVRVTRNADFSAYQEEADDEYDYDFSRLIQNRVEGRTRGDVVRFELSKEISPELSAFLKTHLQIKRSYTFLVKDYFDYEFLFNINHFFDYEAISSLRFNAYRPILPLALSKSNDLISEVKRKDILLIYPYQSMDVLIKILNQAAEDERVTSIKITIYRLSKNSKIISALLKAREHGKEVVALMELCARFDEENNLENAEILKEAGCTIFYGVEDYKVHSKIISISYEEDGEIKYITHIGSGNYNESTAKLYTDLNLITANDEIGRDGNAFFRNIAVLNLDYQYKRLSVAPFSLKKMIISEIDKEIEKRENGLIRAKFNSLTDKECIDKLLEASRAGVKIFLTVRGICSLLPNENISILSIVGRFLEHSRLYIFGSGDDERVYIASADLMTRNLEKRIEIAAPILDKSIKKKLSSYLSLVESDDVKGRRLSSSGTYEKIKTLSSMINSQEELIKKATNDSI